MRSRKALQYAESIDDYARIIKEGNNGGYANDWLIGDRKTGEIAYLELGLKNTPMWRTKDGYFVSSNFARDPKLIREENQRLRSERYVIVNECAARAEPMKWCSAPREHSTWRWPRIFLADHFDSFEKKAQADERSLCGHVDASSRGVKQWDWEAYNPGGAVQGKATDSKMAAKHELRGAGRTSVRSGFWWRLIFWISIRNMRGKSPLPARYEGGTVDEISAGQKNRRTLI